MKKCGLDEPMVSRGIATADVDGDGRLDFALANNWEQSFFFQNQSLSGNAFLGLNLRLPVKCGLGENVTVIDGPFVQNLKSIPALGATVEIQGANGKKLVGQVDGGNGHSGQRAPTLHFGLGENTNPVTVNIKWRDRSGRVCR